MNIFKVVLEDGETRNLADKILGEEKWKQHESEIKQALGGKKKIILSFAPCVKRVSTAFFNGFFEALVEYGNYKMCDINVCFEIDKEHCSYEKIDSVYQLYLEANV